MVDQAKVIEILIKIGEKIEEDKLFLTELDNVIGDGDHGINMARGFADFIAKAPALEGKDAGAVLKAAGMSLVNKVGGASGPLYGTAYMWAGKAAAGKSELTMDDFIEILNQMIEGVKMRGKATTGEKTMLDAMIPAYDAIKAEYAASGDAKKAMEAGVAAAKEGIEYTKTIIATKGRASYLGERSIGHQDPGATSFTEMLEVVCDNI